MSTTYPPIAELVPHKPPMILIDEVLDFAPTLLRARVTLTEASPFVEDGQVPTLVSIEYMAQSIAAFAGLTGRRGGEPVRLGYLIACREMTLAVDSLCAGDELEVRVMQVWSDEQLGHFDCVVLRRGETVAHAWLSVFQGELTGTDGK